MFWLALAVTLTIGFSFICSIWEAALYSISPGRVENLKRSFTSRGRKLAQLRENMDRPVSAILTLNTIAHTAGATLAGSLAQIYLGNEYLTIFSAAFVFAILVFSEIIPKTFGYAYANLLAPLFAWPIQILIWILYPVVLMSEWITKLVKPKKKGERYPTEEDILSVAHLGVRSGGILPEELKWLSSVLRLNNVKAEDIMTSWSNIEHLDSDLLVAELKDKTEYLVHARIPLTKKDNKDDIVGIIRRHEVISAICEGEENLKLSNLAIPIKSINSSTPGHRILKDMIQLEQQIFLVVDESNYTLGIVTIEDVVETMLGEDLEDGTTVHPKVWNPSVSVT